MKRRLFVGTFLDDTQKAELGKLTLEKEKLEALWRRKIKFVKPAKLHQTWIFLGQQEEAQISAFLPLLEKLCLKAQAMEITFDLPRFWPSPKNPAQLVLLASTPPDQVLDLAKQVRKELGAFAEKPDDRPYKPHITLARFPRGEHGKSALFLPDWLKISLPIVLKIDKVTLIESHLGANAEEYSVLHDFALKTS